MVMLYLSVQNYLHNVKLIFFYKSPIFIIQDYIRFYKNIY